MDAMATQDLSIARPDRPDASITAQGQLLIGGETVETHPAQRAEPLAYRNKVLTRIHDGVDMGMHGARLGLKPAGTTLHGALTG